MLTDYNNMEHMKNAIIDRLQTIQPIQYIVKDCYLAGLYYKLAARALKGANITLHSVLSLFLLSWTPARTKKVKFS